MGAIGSVSNTHKGTDETPAANLVEHKKKVVCHTALVVAEIIFISTNYSYISAEVKIDKLILIYNVNNKNISSYK